jgi:hypothetical protein
MDSGGDVQVTVAGGGVAGYEKATDWLYTYDVGELPVRV